MPERVKDALASKVGLDGVAKFTANSNTVKKNVKGIGEAMEITRNQALFLSFGMFALAGIVRKFVNVADNMKDSMFAATRAVEKQETVVNTILPPTAD